MEEIKTNEKRRLKLRERTLAYVVDHQNHSIWVPVILSVLLIGALVFIGVSDNKDRNTVFTPTAHTQSDDDVARFSFAGDIVLGRNVAVRARDIGYEKLFSGMQELWEASDFVMANLDSCVIEGDISEYKTLVQKKAYFYTERENLTALKAAGIDMLSIATDHIADYGRSTIKNAVDELDALGIDHVGAGEDRETAAQYKIVEVQTKSGQTMKIAIFGALGHQDEKTGARAKRVHNDYTESDYTYTEYDTEFEGIDDPESEADTQTVPDVSDSDVTESEETYDPWRVTAGTFSGRNQALIDSINDVRSKVDCVIVYIHWGDNKMFVESSDMRELAHTYVDAGADIIIGTNPRVLLPMEIYKSRMKNGYIFYSIGSLVYDEAESRVCDSILLDLVIDENMNKRLEITPLRISDAVPAETHIGFYSKRIFTKLTKDIDSGAYTYDGNKLIIDMN